MRGTWRIPLNHVVRFQVDHSSTDLANGLFLELLVASKDHIPAVKITGANHSLLFAANLVDDIIPDHCSSMSMQTEVFPSDPTPVSPVANNEHLDDIERLSDEELEFDEFLMDAAEWL